MIYLGKILPNSLLVVSLLLASFANSAAPSHEKKVAYFGTKCDKSASGSTLVLLDTTDSLRPEQVQFVLDNFIADFKWSTEGESYTVVALGNKPVALMPVTSFCTPKPEHKIDTVLDPIAKIKAENIWFKEAAAETVKKMASENTGNSDQTLLVEAVTEVYRNARYNFKDGARRKLILITDFYQHSKIISFFRMCKRKDILHSRPLTCPTLADAVKDNSRFSNYLVKAKPALSSADVVVAYYLNVDGRVDRSAETWWIDYFEHAGLPQGSITIIPELQ
jgi:hypothetical protein